MNARQRRTARRERKALVQRGVNCFSMTITFADGTKRVFGPGFLTWANSTAEKFQRVNCAATFLDEVPQ